VSVIDDVVMMIDCNGGGGDGGGVDPAAAVGSAERLKSHACQLVSVITAFKHVTDKH
jgi:hypothetical protein